VQLDDPHVLEEALTAFEVDWQDGNVDGDPPDLHVSSLDLDPSNCISHSTTLGPRQLLLEAAPCTSCKLNFKGKGARSVICDFCNAPYHLGCTTLKSVPSTYWFCKACMAHILARSTQCPTEDILLQ
jgi:hypothetical protein